MTTETGRYRVFTVVERQDDTPFWLNIGIAFPHKDGKAAMFLDDGVALDRFADRDGRELTIKHMEMRVRPRVDD